MSYPKLRNIEAFPIEYEGEKLLCLRDPTHLSDRPLFVKSSSVFLLSQLDGRQSTSDIQAAYTKQVGYAIPSEQIHDLIYQLDEHLLLDSEHFRQRKKSIEDTFSRAECRQAAHAGTAYEAEPLDLAAQIERFFTEAIGPGSLQPADSTEPVAALIAPHIDFHRGGHCYALSYQALKGSLDADIYVILGIGHAGLQHSFTMTMKDFSTPFGVMKTERAFVEQVQAACPFDVMEDEFQHKNEHSVEFQIIFLQYLLQARSNATIVPVLCGSFHEMIHSGKTPLKHPEVSGFIRALKDAIDTYGKRVCVIAGVDLAHVGMRFGDSEPLTEAFLDKVQQSDLQLLQHVENLDAEALFHNLASTHDQYRVCGYPAIYTMLSVVNPRKGTLIQYDQAADHATQQAVSFASMVFN
jgi:MEMO1 family protein